MEVPVLDNFGDSFGFTWDPFFVSPGDWTEDTNPQFIADSVSTPGLAQTLVQPAFTPSTLPLEDDPSLLLQDTQVDVSDSKAWTETESVAELDLIFLSPEHDNTMYVPALGPASPSSPASIQPSDAQPSLATVPQYGVQYTGIAPILLASVTLDIISSDQLLFTFGVLSIMAHLRPQFRFTYGGDGNRGIGVTLAIYGHTVVVPPIAEGIRAARLIACRKALEELRRHNPRWLLPPLPMNESNSSGWPWVQLLEDCCVNLGWPFPEYVKLIHQDQWHCDVVVNGELFRSVRQRRTPSEAQDMVAHAALYHLLVSRFFDAGTVLPAER